MNRDEAPHHLIPPATTPGNNQRKEPSMDVQLYGSYTTTRYRAATRDEIERMLRAPRRPADGGQGEAGWPPAPARAGGANPPPEAVTPYRDAAARPCGDEAERLAGEHLAGAGPAVTGREPGR